MSKENNEMVTSVQVNIPDEFPIDDVSDEHLPIPITSIKERIGTHGWNYSTLPPLASNIATVSRMIRFAKGPAVDFDQLRQQNKPFEFQWILVLPHERLDENGELHQFAGIKWIAPDLSVVSGGGITALRSLCDLIAALELQWPLDDPIKVLPQQGTAKNGHVFNYLIPVE